MMGAANIFGALATQLRATNCRNPAQVNDILRRFWHDITVLARFLSHILLYGGHRTWKKQIKQKKVCFRIFRPKLSSFKFISVYLFCCSSENVNAFFCGAAPQIVHRRLSAEDPRSHTIRHTHTHTHGRTGPTTTNNTATTTLLR
jgi:hypothetical protein